MSTATTAALVERLTQAIVSGLPVIPWGAPIPAFGDLSRSRVATVGLNPSNREFVDASGEELDGSARRFHSLNSLRIASWADAKEHHLQLIEASCRHYFSGNPYDTWFRRLDHIVGGTNTSYYDTLIGLACHVDLIPYATACKWSALASRERTRLLDIAGDTLGLLLAESAVETLILNGSSVVSNFETICSITLNRKLMAAWSLPRERGDSVPGIAYTGTITQIANIELKKKIQVLGFNHNIQSSFGVTTRATQAIRRWVKENTTRVPQ